MDIQQINKLETDIARFKNAKLVSLVDDANVIVENTLTGARFVLPFTEADGAFIFHGATAEQIKDGNKTKEQEFQINVKNLFEGVKSIFDDKEEGVKRVRTLIKELPFVESFEVMQETSHVNKATELKYFKQFQTIVNAMNEEKEAFIKSNTIFDNSNAIVAQDILPSSIFESISSAQEEMRSFLEKANQFKALKNSLIANFDEELAAVILDTIDFSESFDIKAKASKLLVQAKQKNSNIDIVSGVKKLTSIFEDGIAPSLASNYVYNYAKTATEAPKFLKFRTGEFSVQDIAVMLEELDVALASIGEINDEDLEYIANNKSILEYMVRTQKISDKIVKQLIEDFNKRFNKANDDAYIASEMGFKSREESNKRGMETI